MTHQGHEPAEAEHPSDAILSRRFGGPVGRLRVWLRVGELENHRGDHRNLAVSRIRVGPTHDELRKDDSEVVDAHDGATGDWTRSSVLHALPGAFNVGCRIASSERSTISGSSRTVRC